MNLGLTAMSFIDQITSDIKEFTEKNKLQKEMVLDVLIDVLQEIKNKTHNHG